MKLKQLKMQLQKMPQLTTKRRFKLTIKNLDAKDVNAAINKIPDVKVQETLPYLIEQIEEYSTLVEKQAEENNKLMAHCIELAGSINAKL